MAKAAATTRAFGAEMNRQVKTNSQLQGALGKFGLSTNMVMGGAVAGGFLAASKAAIDFESSFAGVRKTVDASEAEFKALASGMRDLAKEIPVNVNELNAIGEAAGQLGIKTENILEFTEVMAKLGVTTNLSSDQAATQLARLANITKMPQENFDALGSAVVALGNASEATESEIVDFALRMAGAGEVAGLAEADILAIGTAMSSVGVESERGGTAVQKVLLSMNDSVAQSDEKLATFAETAGMSAQQFQSAWQADPAQAFTAFVEGLGRAGDDATVILKKLGLADQRLIGAFLSLAGAGDTLRSSVELGNDAMSRASALNEEAAKRFETTESQIQLAKNAVNDLAIEFGSTLLPSIENTAEAIAQLATGLTEVLSLATDLIGKIPDDLIPEGIKAPWDLKGLLDFSSTDALTLGASKFLPDAWTDWIPSVEFNPMDWFEDEEKVTGGLRGFIGAWGEVGSAAASAGSTMASSMDPLLEKIEETKSSYKELEGILSGATGFLDIEGAAIGLKEAQKALNEVVKDGKKGTLEYRRAMLNVLTSQKDLEASLLSYTEKVESGEVSQRDAVSAVRAFGDAAGLTRGQVDDLIDRIKDYDSSLDGLPDRKRTKVEAEGLTEAQRALQIWKNQLELIPRSVTTTVSVHTIGAGTYGNKTLVNHAGGPAGSGAVRYGSMLRSDEYPTILQKGEVTFSKAQVKAMANSPGNVIYVDARGSALTEAQITRAVEKGIDKRQHSDARFDRATTQVAT